MAEDSQKIITEIQGLEGQIEMYQSEIDTWIKTVGEMEAFVEKVKNVSEPFEKKCRNMAKLKEYLGGERKRRWFFLHVLEGFIVVLLLRYFNRFHSNFDIISNKVKENELIISVICDICPSCRALNFLFDKLLWLSCFLDFLIHFSGIRGHSLDILNIPFGKINLCFQILHFIPRITWINLQKRDTFKSPHYLLHLYGLHRCLFVYFVIYLYAQLCDNFVKMKVHL